MDGLVKAARAATDQLRQTNGGTQTMFCRGEVKNAPMGRKGGIVAAAAAALTSESHSVEAEVSLVFYFAYNKDIV